MKYKNYFLLITIIMAGFFTFKFFFIREKSSANFKTYQTQEPKNSQTFEKLLEDDAQIKRNIANVIVEKNIKEQKASIKLRKLEKNPVINFLNVQIGQYQWSPDVYASPEKNIKKDSVELLGKYDDLTIFRSSNRPDGAFNLIHSTKTGKVGLYMEQLIILHEKSSELETFITKINGSAPNFTNGVYFVPVENFSDAQDLGNRITNEFNRAKIDLDINYNRVKAN